MYNNDRICIDFGNSLVPQDVQITHNGKDVSGISKIQIVVEPNESIKTELTFCNAALLNLKSEVKVFLIDPNDGKLKEVESIKFKNENS